ncbi:MAG: polysaccharide biosynthesis protein [Prevotella sp.]|nr:polysaccharide biosynthesis protein [Prevotella sp.]
MITINKILNWYFNKKSLPYWCMLLLDALILFISGIFSFWLYRKTNLLVEDRFQVFYTMLVFTLFGCIGFRMFRTYSGIVRYSSFVDLSRVAYGNLLAMALSFGYTLLMHSRGFNDIAVFNKTEILLTFVIATVLMWAIRILVRNLYNIAITDKGAMRVLIFGALKGGVGLAKNINTERPKRFNLCGFISHDSRAHRIQLMGLNVYHISDDLEEIIKHEGIGGILVSPLRVKEFRDDTTLQDRLIKAGCKIFMAESAKELDEIEMTDDDFQRMQLREVQVEDLLPRQEIKVDMDSVGALLAGKTVLITGSAGSIGSEMVRQIAVYKPAKMVLIDQAETPEHDIRLMMAHDYPNVDAETIVTSICKADRMEQVFETYKPDYVFHAAAYKHVPMMENNPSEAVQNNIYGTKVIADLSVKYGVKKFVMVSTDKAVNPTNVMGCSKRICEIYVQSLNNSQTVTQFVTTRFGNVLGSNGSVIPLFREQIRNGGPVTVTDERIVRFFMLIPEACKLVLEAGTKGHGGEIFVFDMGKPVKIADLAKRMIALSGAKNIEIKYTGLRPGEKLYEEVLNELEGTKPSFHEKIRIADVREYDFAEVRKEVDELVELSKQYDDMATVAKMKLIVPEYKSNNSVYEKLDGGCGGAAR